MRFRTLQRLTKGSILGCVLLAECGLCQTPGTVRWVAQIGTLDIQPRKSSSPAIGADGTIYVGGGDPRSEFTTCRLLYAISPQGTTNWTFTAGGGISGSPAIGSDGTIYVGAGGSDRNVYAINANGTTNWAFQTGGEVRSSPAVGADGTIYVVAVSNYFNQLYALRPDSTIKWVFTMGAVETYGQFSCQAPSPAIGPDGTIYLGSMDTNLYSIAPNGATNWVFRLGDATYASPAIGVDGTVYIGADDTKLYAIDRQGHERWVFSGNSVIESSAAIGADGTIYFGSLGGTMYALDSGGALRWAETNNGGFISGSPAIAADGTVYCGIGTPNYYYAIRAWDSSGGKVWTYNAWSAGGVSLVASSSAIGPDGTIYILAANWLWAIYGSSPLQQSSWPMFRRDARHNARAIQRGVEVPVALADGSISLRLGMDTGRTYRVEASTDLANWTELTNFIGSSCSTQFVDRSATGFARRYYRLRTP